VAPDGFSKQKGFCYGIRQQPARRVVGPGPGTGLFWLHRRARPTGRRAASGGSEPAPAQGNSPPDDPRFAEFDRRRKPCLVPGRSRSRPGPPDCRRFPGLPAFRPPSQALIVKRPCRRSREPSGALRKRSRSARGTYARPVINSCHNGRAGELLWQLADKSAIPP
jgi:hypothetical protein